MNGHYFVFYVPCSDEEEEEKNKIRNQFSIFIDWMKMIHDEFVMCYALHIQNYDMGNRKYSEN